MSVAQLESRLLELSPQERLEFALWFYQHEAQIVDWDKGGPGTQVQMEIIRRDRELDENNSLGVPVTQEGFDQLRKKLADARAAQTSAR
jgi:hypothetical protein